MNSPLETDGSYVIVKKPSHNMINTETMRTEETSHAICYMCTRCMEQQKNLDSGKLVKLQKLQSRLERWHALNGLFLFIICFLLAALVVISSYL